MSICNTILYDENRPLDAEWWTSVAVKLAEAHRFALHFYQGEEATWTQVRDWERIRVPRAVPGCRFPIHAKGSSSFFYLRDRPGSNQAPIACNASLHQFSADPRYESAPYSQSWPGKLGARLRTLRGNLELQVLYLDNEPFEFFNALQETITAQLDGYLYVPSTGMLIAAGGREYRATD